MNASAESKPEVRLRSLDALRGFDMLWITGGRELLLTGVAALGWSAPWLVHQFEHAPWHGVRAWDLIFPLFLFLAGVSMPYSFSARRAKGHGERMIALHALRRGATLVLLGAVYNGLLAFDWEHLRWASVLGRIGLAWMVAAWIAQVCGPRGRAVAAAVILAVYGACLLYLPVPEYGAGDLAQGRNVGDWFDQQFLPGRSHREGHDPEGLLSTLPAVATALCGVLAGDWIRRSGPRAVTWVALAAVGGALIALGHALDGVLPMNKRLWTPTFTVWAAGWSAVLLALFFAVVDVRGWRAWTTPFVWIGANAITIYLARRFIDFDGVAHLLFGQAAERGALHPWLLGASAFALQLALLAWLYRRRWFLRV